VRKKPGVGVSELADFERMSRPSMSAHVKRWRPAGWIARQAPDAEDKRRVGLALTVAGGKALDAVRRRRNDWLARQLTASRPRRARRWRRPSARSSRSRRAVMNRMTLGAPERSTRWRWTPSRRRSPPAP